jgi:uracil-DNA glycosylase
MSGYDALLNEARACSLCADHLPLGPRPVIQASRRSSILIVGQAPGRRVHASGIPFDDASGDRLRAWLGVDRKSFYDANRFAIVPMGFCYPGTGRSGDLPPRPECAPAWRERILAPLVHVKLTLVLGAYALAYHIKPGRRSLTSVVADWSSYWPEVLPLPHPSPRNIRWFRTNPWFETDVIPILQKRVAGMLDNPTS